MFSVLLVFATGGIGLFQHYCSCSGILSQSVLVEKKDCHDGHYCSVKPVQEPLSCCSAESNEKAQDNTCCNDDHHCCKTDYKYLKTDNMDFSASGKKNFKPVLALLAVFSEIYSDSKESEPSYFHQINHDPPAPVYGRDLIISIQQLKIASPLA